MLGRRIIFWLIAALVVSGHVALIHAQSITWEKTSGSLSGTVSSFVAAKSGDLLAATINPSGLFRTSDRGDHWSQVTGFPYSSSAVSLAVTPDGVLFAGGGSGIWRSTDGGVSWTTIFPGVWSLAVGDDGTLYLGSMTIFVSSDTGASFQHFGPCCPTATNVLAPSENGIVFAGEAIMHSDGYGFPSPYGVLLRYTDHGSSWTEIVNRGYNFPTFAGVVASAGGLVLASVNTLFIRSTDNGATWTDFPAAASSLVCPRANRSGPESGICLDRLIVLPVNRFRHHMGRGEGRSRCCPPWAPLY